MLFPITDVITIVCGYLLLIGKFLVVVVVAVADDSIPSVAERGYYLGCFHHSMTGGILRPISNAYAGNVDNCIGGCETEYFRYSIPSNSDCLCSNSILAQELPHENCSSICQSGQPSKMVQQSCGGPSAQSYYDTGLQYPGPVSNVQLINRTERSITLRWTPTEQINLLSNYIIENVAVHSYDDFLLPSPKFTVQKKETQFELIDLHPAVTYNVTIISMSLVGGAGGQHSFMAQTDIGTPDPPPEQPKILSETDTTRVISIQPATNVNGPITWYRVIVVLIDSGIVQKFDEKLLKNYDKAQEDGTPYYIAAELEWNKMERRFTVGDGRTYRGYSNPPLPAGAHVHIGLGLVSVQDDLMKVRYSVTTHEQHDVTMIMDDSNDSSDILLITLVVACIIFGLLLVASIGIYFYLRLRMEHRLQRLPSEHHELTPQGPIIEVENNAYMPDDFLIKQDFEQKLDEILKRIDGSQNFPRKMLQLDMNNLIGTGNYGDVIRGHLQQQRVQVHVISDDMEPLDQVQFLKEFQTILKITSHSNVLSFMGYTQTTDWLYILFEDAPFTLKKRLVEARVPPNIDIHRFSAFSEEFVLRILSEICNAFVYLSGEHKFIHKRLSSFNIRMTMDDEIKISGFGATPFDDQGHKIDLSRWSAPEVIRFQHHSVKSDVWAFGCVMWESCCLGATLYSNISSDDLAQRIKSGTRPEHVSFLFDDIYQLMLNCWQLDPSERPEFSDISFSLRQMLTSPQHVMSYNRREGVILPYYLPLLEIQNSI